MENLKPSTWLSNPVTQPMFSATGSDSSEWSLQWTVSVSDSEESGSQIWIIFVATIFGLISFIGVIGNALVIYVILSKRQMRTVTNILLLNLAIADLCFVLIVPPMTAYTIIHDSKWWLGLVACKLMHYVTNVSGYVTVYTLVLVSAVRYMTVVHGVTTARLRTIRNVVIMIVTIWVTMLAANSPILSAYELRNLNDRNSLHTEEFLCLETSREIGRYIFVTFFAFSYVIPLTVIAIFSLGILHYISKHRAGGLQVSSNVNVRSSARKRQASRLLVLVVVIFAMLWLPLHVHLIALHFRLIDGKNAFYDKLSFIFCCLAYFNSCVNPFIYDHMSKDFRDAFREVMHCSNSQTLPPAAAADVAPCRADENNQGNSVGYRHCSQQENIIQPLKLSGHDENVNGESKMAAVVLQSCNDLNDYSETHQYGEELVVLCVETMDSMVQQPGSQV